MTSATHHPAKLPHLINRMVEINSLRRKGACKNDIDKLGENLDLMRYVALYCGRYGINDNSCQALLERIESEWVRYNMLQTSHITRIAGVAFVK